MANIDDVTSLPDNIGLGPDDEVGIFYFDGDPSLLGFEAPEGSLSLSSNNKLYRKIGATDTDWRPDLENLADQLDVNFTSPQNGDIVSYDNTSSKWINTNVNDLLLTSSLPSVQIRRSTSFNIPATYVDIPFDITDVENDVTIIEHDDTNTDRVVVKESGLYKISINGSWDIDSLGVYTMRTRINDSTVVPGSIRTIDDSTNVFDVGGDFIVSLSANDYLTTQITSNGPTDANIEPEITFCIFKLSGSKGEKGDAGTGSSVIIEDNDVTVTGGPHSTLNFEGNVTLTDNGSGKVTIGVGSGGSIAVEQFYAYDTAGETEVTSVDSFLTLDTEVKEDVAYSHATDSEEIIFNTTDTYEITYYVAIYAYSGTSRSEVEVRLLEDVGLGYVDITGTTGLIYVRGVNPGKGSSASVTIIRDFNAGDKIKLAAKRTGGSAPMRTLPNGVGIVITRYDESTGSSNGTCGYTYPFGIHSAVSLGTSNIPAINESSVGYLMPTDKTIKNISVITDILNNNSYQLLKNGSLLHAIEFEDNPIDQNPVSEKYVSGLSLPLVAGDVLTAQFVDTFSNFDSEYTADSNTLFLGKFEESNIITDRHIKNYSTIAKGMSGNVVGCTLGTSGKFNKAADFDGSNDYIEILHHKDYDIQDLTWECWFNTDTTSNGDDIIFSKDSSGYDTGGHFYICRNGNDIQFRSQSTNNETAQTINTSLSSGTWYHLAVVFGTGGIKVFLDGTNIYSDTNWTQGWNGNREPIAIGAANSSSGNGINSSLSNYWKGKICEMRISNTRRYENNFTPAVTQFINDANTIGLWHFDETSGNLIYDSSDTIHNAMIQANGSYPSISTSTYKIGSQSIKMNNSENDWFTFYHTPDYEVTEFTVECWVYQYTDDSNGIIFQKGSSSTEGGLVVEWVDIGDKLSVKYYGASSSRTIITPTNSFHSYEWHHVSVTINTTEIKVYIDGVVVGTEALTIDFQNGWANNKMDVCVGKGCDNTDYLQAYIDEFRISKVVREYGTSGSVKDISMIVEAE